MKCETLKIVCLVKPELQTNTPYHSYSNSYINVLLYFMNIFAVMYLQNTETLSVLA